MIKQPHNETETHFMLKEIGKYILWSWGYTKIATEVYGMYSYDIRNPEKDFKNIIDVVGAKKVEKFIPGVGYAAPYYEIKGIEAKASLSDFKNGFCAAPAHTYIIAPTGIIPHELIPEKIGLIEVDFKKFVIKKRSNKIEIDGVNLAIKPKRRLDSRFQNVEQYRKWSIVTLDRIAYRCSMELLLWRNIIEFEQRDPERKHQSQNGYSQL